MIKNNGSTSIDFNDLNKSTNQQDRLNQLSPSSTIGTANSFDYDKKIRNDLNASSTNMSLKRVKERLNNNNLDDEFAPLDLTKSSLQNSTSNGSEKAIELLHNLHKHLNNNYQLHQQQLLQQQFNGQLAAVAQGYFSGSGSANNIGNNLINSSSGNENGLSSNQPGLNNLSNSNIDDSTAADELNALLQRTTNKRKHDQLMQDMAAVVSNSLNQQQQNASNAILAGLPFNLQSAATSFENLYTNNRLQPAIKRRGRPENSSRRATVNDMISLNGLFGNKTDDLTGASKLCNQILKQNSPLNSNSLSHSLLNRNDQLMPITITSPNGQLMYPCDKCDKTFSKQSSLARHKYEHSGRGEISLDFFLNFSFKTLLNVMIIFKKKTNS